jgi:hypothetical protein
MTMTTTTHIDGESPDNPKLLGRPIRRTYKHPKGTPVFVEATGLYMGVQKGRRLWVAGDKVQKGIETGSLVLADVES